MNTAIGGRNKIQIHPPIWGQIPVLQGATEKNFNDSFISAAHYHLYLFVHIHHQSWCPDVVMV